MAEVEKNAAVGAQQPQPGQVVSPGTAQQPVAPGQAGPSLQPQVPVEQLGASSQPTQTASQSQPQVSAANPAPESFMRGQTADPLPEQAAASIPAAGAISWTASEFIAHEKSSSWYLGLAAIAIVIAGFVFLITRDIISTIVVLIGATAFGVLGGRKPRQQQYNLDVSGLTIGQKHYDFGQFRSFSVVPEGAFSSIVLTPMKRFAQLTTIYYAPEDEDKIVNLISQSLPFEERRVDAVDNLMKRVRF